MFGWRQLPSTHGKEPTETLRRRAPHPRKPFNATFGQGCASRTTMKQKNGVGQHAPRKTRNSQNIKKASQSAQEIRGTPTTSNPTQMRRRPILWTSRKFAHTGSPIQSYINKSTNHLQIARFVAPETGVTKSHQNRSR